MNSVTTANIADKVARDRPSQPAVTSLDATGQVVSTLTYAELDQAIGARAAWLTQQLQRGDCVGILAENSASWLVTFYAIERAGMIAVPLSSRAPAQTIAELATTSKVRLLFTDALGARLVNDVPIPTVDIDEQSPIADFQSVTVEPTDTAMVLFTSGSTGLPKGVRLSHASHSWVIDQLAVPCAPGAERILISAPLFHMNALSNSQRGLYAGAQLFFLPRFEASAYLTVINDQRITRLSGVAPMFELLLRKPQEIAAADLTSVTAIYLGSAPATGDLIARLEETFANADVRHGFGTTESGPVAFAPHPEGLPTPAGSVGVPHPAVDVRLVDAHGRATEGTGVLELRSPALMSGYHYRPDLVPPVTYDGYHHTKDLFFVDEDGFYFFAGREDDMFASGGENVYPRPVEQALESHPAIQEAVVVPVPDPIKAHKPVAFVVLRPGESVSEEEAKAHALKHLEPYAHPRRVWFLDAMPLTGANKADRAALTALAVQRTAS